MAEASSPDLREQANIFYKEGRHAEAVELYIQALRREGLSDEEKSLLYNNRAACCLKLGRYLQAKVSASLCK